jgi:cyclic beta-1,2-glucan synthetase
LLGEGTNRAESLALIGQAQEDGQIEAIWQSVQQQWEEILSGITVETPDPSMDLMLNRWLLYQTLVAACGDARRCINPAGRLVSATNSRM